ncbi:MAG: zinc-dependent peptidase [Verrucomicrobiota bacterium JB025]|nr:zinc-dependent peptidase [Verrucomicrobiota bacterium JB025]
MIWQALKTLFTRSATPVFQDDWIAMLEENLPLYQKLPGDLRPLLHQRIARFVASTRFEGCGGLELTEEMIITIAAQASLLVLHRDGTPYPELRTVYLYPTTFSSVQKRVDPIGIVTEGEVSRLGESWSSGTVVLAWDSVAHGARDLLDGQNVTFHEFAHQLDHEDGPTDGAPPLPSRAAYRSWAKVFSENYDDFLDQLETGKRTLLDPYGATNPAEFFAVATETFFEKPRQLKKKRPDLYQKLQSYYQLDPAKWFRGN